MRGILTGPLNDSLCKEILSIVYRSGSSFGDMHHKLACLDNVKYKKATGETCMIDLTYWGLLLAAAVGPVIRGSFPARSPLSTVDALFV